MDRLSAALVILISRLSFGDRHKAARCFDSAPRWRNVNVMFSLNHPHTVGLLASLQFAAWFDKTTNKSGKTRFSAFEYFPRSSSDISDYYLQVEIT